MSRLTVLFSELDTYGEGLKRADESDPLKKYRGSHGTSAGSLNLMCRTIVKSVSNYLYQTK